MNIMDFAFKEVCGGHVSEEANAKQAASKNYPNWPLDNLTLAVVATKKRFVPCEIHIDTDRLRDTENIRVEIYDPILGRSLGGAVDETVALALWNALYTVVNAE